jgi:hypothetical protein
MEANNLRFLKGGNFMDLKKKFDFVNSKLETLMAFQEISSRDYVAISKQLMRAEDHFDLSNVMTEMETAAIKEQARKNKEKREREEKREERRRAK